MTIEFKPNNPLEEKLLAMYRKEIKITDFLDILLDSQVIILADKDVDITGPDMNFKPLAITSPMKYNVLATFSSVERAQAAVSRYPEYAFAVSVDTSWFLQRAFENVGFALNPGWPFGFELSPDGLQQMLIRFGVKEPVRESLKPN
jgi:hypothetical protein